MDNDRLVRILQATPEQQQAIDRILSNEPPPSSTAPITGPMLYNMTKAARFLGVSRTTLWRIIQAGHLNRVEVMAGTFRIRHQDLLTLAEKGVGAES